MATGAVAMSTVLAIAAAAIHTPTGGNLDSICDLRVDDGGTTTGCDCDNATGTGELIE